MLKKIYSIFDIEKFVNNIKKGKIYISNKKHNVKKKN